LLFLLAVILKIAMPSYYLFYMHPVSDSISKEPLNGKYEGWIEVTSEFPLSYYIFRFGTLVYEINGNKHEGLYYSVLNDTAYLIRTNTARRLIQ